MESFHYTGVFNTYSYQRENYTPSKSQTTIIPMQLNSFLPHFVKSNIEQVLAATPHKVPTIRSPTTYHENYPS